MSPIAPDLRALEARLEAMLVPVVDAAGLELLAVRLTPAGRGLRLLLQIDRREGDGAVGLRDCTTVSKKVSALLDVKDPIEPEYDLEVSSPGMNRPLRGVADFLRFAGITAKVTLAGADGLGRRSVNGVLIGCVDGTLRLRTGKDEEQTFAVADIQRAALNPTFDEWQALGRKLAAQDAAKGRAAGDEIDDDPEDDGASDDGAEQE